MVEFSRAHSLADEMRFIEGAGKFSEKGEKAGKAAVLTMYKESIKSRTDWDKFTADDVALINQKITEELKNV